MTLTSQLVTAGALVGLFILGICLWSLNTSEGVVTINGTELNVLVAEHTLAQKKGLSGYTEETLTQDGMLFVFADSEVRTFWMKGMKFDLDVVWIGDGRILAIDRNVQAPYSRADEPETMTSNPLLVDAVLELPAGKVEEFGILEGMSVTLPE